MNKIIATGKTIQEAIENGLKELGVDRDQIETNVLEIPQKGFFGLFGNREAKVQIILKDNIEETAKKFLEQILNKMKIQANIKTKLCEDVLRIEIEGNNMGILIGRRGETLDAIQYLVSLAINKNRDGYVRVILDTENYREKRQQTLQQLADRLARKVEKTGKSITLEPMNPYERRIIHTYLQDHPKVRTYSEGEDPYRKVVLSLKK
ncbi:RNA-binding cell elongation regulator Jag/EloR [Garciella nitratireducens]|uniref:RNA-binding protein KhpB n=1 Tax=Garciella nitratireducens DSM 15102 TaxID=1121911 RepID=A0A1T4PDX9_9FIRM|nr:RNA-binding cell elongation regulator Jag/EloR [Garciella nitratireducens]SJZ89436.1 spoIIIJ-associated protein [Garciella nitratireducens DSM 15102]